MANKKLTTHYLWRLQGISDTPIEKRDTYEYASDRFGRLLDSMRVQDSQKLIIQPALSVLTESLRWVYNDWLLAGELTIVAGPPGAGKTTFLCALAAGVSLGRIFELAPKPVSPLDKESVSRTNMTTSESVGTLRISPNGSGFVLFVNLEDDVARTLRPRLEAMHANMEKIMFIDTRPQAGDDAGFSFSDERSIERLQCRAETELQNNVGLIVVDPVYFAVDGDPGDNSKSRQAYQNLTALAKRLGCAIVGIAHTSRNVRGKTPLERVAGAPALREVPRAIILLNKITNGPTETGGTYVAVHAKNNNGRVDGGFEYRIAGAEIADPAGSTMTSKFEITRELFGSAEDILQEADSTRPVAATSKLEAAIVFLKNVLKEGPRLQREILQLALQAKISQGTLTNAKISLKVVTSKRNGDGYSVWKLPTS